MSDSPKTLFHDEYDTGSVTQPRRKSCKRGKVKRMKIVTRVPRPWEKAFPAIRASTEWAKVCASARLIVRVWAAAGEDSAATNALALPVLIKTCLQLVHNCTPLKSIHFPDIWDRGGDERCGGERAGWVGGAAGLSMLNGEGGGGVDG